MQSTGAVKARDPFKALVWFWLEYGLYMYCFGGRVDKVPGTPFVIDEGDPQFDIGPNDFGLVSDLADTQPNMLDLEPKPV